MTSCLEKVCKMCGRTKPVADFYKKHSECKSCSAAMKREYVARNRERHLLQAREYAKRQYSLRRDELLEKAKSWRKKNADWVRSYNSRYSSDNPEKIVAHEKVRQALESGVLTRPVSCDFCDVSDAKLESHHDDYDKPLSVLWLCSQCHHSLHAEERLIVLC